MLNIYIIALFLMSFFIVNFGMFNADFRGKGKMDREAMGMVVFFTTVLSLMNFIGLFVALCLTGFAEHGFSYKLKLDE